MHVNDPRVLIISNKFDFTTDHVAYQLHNMGVPYLRLNRDEFSNMELQLDPLAQTLTGNSDQLSFRIRGVALESVYFRAPVFLRENQPPDLSADEQLSRSQWAAFLRSLTVFDAALWVNHPRATYQAEVKPYQLKVANETGFRIPATLITNSPRSAGLVALNNHIVAKTLDTFVFRIAEKEGFVYSNLVSIEELNSATLSHAPIIAQAPLIPKTDVRVTVVGKTVTAITITSNSSNPVPLDWRTQKDGLSYSLISLPYDVESGCINLVQKLGLSFGAIDLILQDDTYYFVEINPTGEWAWLMQSIPVRIDMQIASLLSNGKC